MDEELVKDLADKAGVTDSALAPWMTDYGHSKEAILKFATLVAEECAKVCEGLWRIDGQFTADEFAAEIRAKFPAPANTPKE